MIQTVQIIAALFGMSAIILGAFGAHKLKKILNTELLQSFETGVKYQMYHAIVLLILSFSLEFKNILEIWIAYCFVVGTILFSFSIYGLCFGSSKGNKWKYLGPITPIGGLLLVVGWALLLYHFLINR